MIVLGICLGYDDLRTRKASGVRYQQLCTPVFGVGTPRVLAGNEEFREAVPAPFDEALARHFGNAEPILEPSTRVSDRASLEPDTGTQQGRPAISAPHPERTKFRAPGQCIDRPPRMRGNPVLSRNHVHRTCRNHPGRNTRFDERSGNLSKGSVASAAPYEVRAVGKVITNQSGRVVLSASDQQAALVPTGGKVILHTFRRRSPPPLASRRVMDEKRFPHTSWG